MVRKKGISDKSKGIEKPNNEVQTKVKKSTRNNGESDVKETDRRNSLELLDIETDESGSDREQNKEEILAFHRDDDEGVNESDFPAPSKAGKRPPVFKSKSFFKLNNNLMMSGKIGGRNLLSSSVGEKGKNSKESKRSATMKNRLKDLAANPIEEAQRKSAIYDPTRVAAPPLIPAKTKKEKTLGKGWFDMKPATLDGTMKGDIKMVEMRNYLDPKRFYKNPDKIRKVLHVGTVIEGAAEYTTNRMTKKERKQSLVGEIIADKQIKDYTKRKYVEIQQEKEAKSGRKKKSKKPGIRDGVGSGSRKVRKLF